ncbi:MAG: 3-deoxy-manno-octulosonate cytidylyltransferase [Gemmatimonadota bacterium]|nr:MAG: 3-deoxy-manno-octulosonate cytidylyltransferase [Gemmatimonadota bacterium]
MLSGAQTSSKAPSGGGEGGSVLGVIPARLASTRLPRKPLAPVAGRPLIEWVWQRMRALDVLDGLVVAADDPEIVRVVEGFGGLAVMTLADHASGTERVAEVAERPEYREFDWIVNLQGDEPFLPVGAAETAITLVKTGWDIGTAAVPVTTADEWEDPSTVKVVVDDAGGALYFSRAPIPHDRVGSAQFGEAGQAMPLRHVGIYSFRRAALRRATALPAHPLERREGLEQLRWLSAGLRIGVGVVEGGGPGIDTEADLARAEEILRGREGST